MEQVLAGISLAGSVSHGNTSLAKVTTELIRCLKDRGWRGGPKKFVSNKKDGLKNWALKEICIQKKSAQKSLGSKDFGSRKIGLRRAF